jgi:drug/metabolite transporter (DMT)-like permease
MELAALALALVAAALHAAWNLLAKRASGGAGFVWSCAAAGAVLWAPLGLGALALGGRPEGAALGLMLGSGALHAGYFLLLQRGYGAGDLSLVYPIARGTGPLLAVPLAAVLLGERPGPAGVAGGAVIVASVLLLTSRPKPGEGRAIGFAVATGALIAAYTLWDALAVGRLDLSPVTYFWGAEVCRSTLLAPLALRRPQALRQVWRRERRVVLWVAVLSPLSYVLVLFALRLAPVSLVAPAREVGIVLGALLGRVVLGEPAGTRRLPAAVGVVVGVALLASS